MFELTVRTKFSAAHKLMCYEGQCAKLHGHTWLVDVFVSGSKLNDAGMLVDFVELKNIVKDTVKNFDHSYLNEIPPFTQKKGNGFLNPTAENIAWVIFHAVKNKLTTKAPQAKVKKVRIWESPNAAATYSE